MQKDENLMLIFKITMSDIRHKNVRIKNQIVVKNIT